MRWLRALIGWGLVVGIVGLVGWLGYLNYQNQNADETEYRFDKATRGNLHVYVEASGTLEPEEAIDVGAQVAGLVLSFGKDPADSSKVITWGTKVKEGTLLAQLDDRLFDNKVKLTKATLDKCRADVRSSEARQSQAERDWKRIQDVRGSKAVTEQEIDTARATLEGAQADLIHCKAAVGEAESNLKDAQINLDYTRITSPVDGVVIDRRVNIGQTVVASLNAPSLFLIAKDLTKLQIWVSVNESDIGQISVGQKASFTVDTFKNETFHGVVSQIRYNATMSQNVVIYTVVVDTPNPDMKLLPYMTANVRFLVNQRDSVLLVPNAALRFKPNPAKIDPAYRATYEAQNKTRGGGSDHSETKAPGTSDPGKRLGGDNPKGPPGTPVQPQPKKIVTVSDVWSLGENGDLVPIRVRLGASDGKRTEVLEVLDGQLTEKTELVTGEVPIKKAITVNPFQPPAWNTRKK
jgi:HlyD family secretion protein